VEVVSHRITRDKLINPWNYDNYRYEEYLSQCVAADSIWHQVYQEYLKFYSLDDIFDATLHAAGDAHGVKAQPWQYSFYIQDKMEWEGLVVNAGLRWDGWDLGKYYQQLNDQNVYEKIKFASSERFHFMLSPRLGVSHAISEKSVLHFAFNYQNQLPRFSAIYPDATTYDIYLGNLHWGSVIMGNPQLEPQISITGEIGWQRQVAENYFADLTVYYKKSYNYLSLSQEFLAEDIYYYKYVTDDYGVSRGLDLNLQRTMFDNINASLAYSLGWAEGTSSEHYQLPQGEIDVLEQLSLQEFPLNWDTRHNLAFNLTFRIRDGEEFFLPGTEFLLPFDDFLINFQYNYATGTPYTDVESYEVNNARLPDSQLANLKISKGFNLLGSSKLQLYIKWENLFNDQNINFAYITTGSPYFDGHDFESAEEQTLHEMNTKNPQNVNVQREIMLGMALSW
jgi:hypothetical protein